MHDTLPILREIYPCTIFSLLNLGKVSVVWKESMPMNLVLMINTCELLLRNKMGPETDYLRVFILTKTAIRVTGKCSNFGGSLKYTPLSRRCFSPCYCLIPHAHDSMVSIQTWLPHRSTPSLLSMNTPFCEPKQILVLRVMAP